MFYLMLSKAAIHQQNNMEISPAPSIESQMGFCERKDADRAPPAINLLSPDCRGHVFCFLGLFDCLRFAETSKTSMEQIIKEVECRRRNQFLVRPCEPLYVPSDDNEWDGRLSPRECVAQRVDNNNNNNKSYSETTTKKDGIIDDHPFLYSMTANGGETRRSCYYELPSVLERIEGLYRVIPGTHPFNDKLRTLIMDLKKDTASSTIQNQNQLLKRLSSVTFAHRLHASLLSQCTTDLNPVPYHDRGSYENKNSFTVTLERYMGDVLTARCLIGHSYRSLEEGYYDQSESLCAMGVEGGPSFRRWIDHLPSYLKTESVSARHWYRYWVFFHSSLLRISPFSIDQAEQLKLGPLSGILEPFNMMDDDIINLNNPDTNTNRGRGGREYRRWFLPSNTFAYCSSNDVNALKERIKDFFLPDNDQIYPIGNLETTLHDFGPLGPFRGRDRVTVETMSPSIIYESFFTCLQNCCERTYTSKLTNWLDGSDSHGMIRWMRFLQDESKRVRPMTVQPPLVTIRMINL